MPDAITVILPAAGASRRLGRPKQLVDVGGGETMLRRAARRAVAAGVGPVVVVLGYEGARLARELDGVGCDHVLIPDWEEGMAASVRAGVARAVADPDAAAVLVTLVDQWALEPADLARLAAAWRAGGLPIAAAEYPAGTLGVPAVCAREMFDALIGLRGDAGARHLLRAPDARVTRVPMPRAAADLDEVHQVSAAGTGSR